MSLLTNSKVSVISNFINGTDSSITLKQIHDFNSLMYGLAVHYQDEKLTPSYTIMYALHNEDLQVTLSEYMYEYMNRLNQYTDVRLVILTRNNNPDVYDYNQPTSICDESCTDTVPAPIIEVPAPIYDEEFFKDLEQSDDEPTAISTNKFTDSDFKSEDEFIPAVDNFDEFVEPTVQIETDGPIVLGTIDLRNISSNTLDEYFKDINGLVYNISFNPLPVHIYQVVEPIFDETANQSRNTVQLLMNCISLQEAFERGQNLEERRSTSVGDVINVKDKYFMVCGRGFKEITYHECLGIAF